MIEFVYFLSISVLCVVNELHWSFVDKFRRLIHSKMSDHIIGSTLIQKICTENQKLFTGAYSYEKNDVRLLDSCIEMRQLIFSLIAIWFTERSMVGFLSGFI